MGSKAIAVVIIGMGIMVLIVSACIGAPADGTTHTFSGWPAEAHILTNTVAPTVLAVAARTLPLVEADLGPENEDLACTVAIKLKLPAVQDYNECTFVGQYGSAHGWQCGNRLLRHCIGDFPSTETPEIQDIRNQAKVG